MSAIRRLCHLLEEHLRVDSIITIFSAPDDFKEEIALLSWSPNMSTLEWLIAIGQ
jgi:hypothetical protein